MVYLVRILLTLTITLTWSALGHSTTYYLATSGTDGTAGSSGAPWRTFTYAFGQMSCGDTLVVKNGTYTNSNSGFPLINGRNCSETSPLTIRAENERQAWIAHDGSCSRDTALTIQDSSYITIEGIRASTTDTPSCNTEPIYVLRGSHITFKKLLLHNSNAYQNAHVMEVAGSDAVLIEDAELYNFHRHGIALVNTGGNTTNTVIRRVYCNSRFKLELPTEVHNQKGDSCIAIYPAIGTIVENIIAEDTYSIAEVNAPGTCLDNKILGSIAYHTDVGVFIDSRGYATDQMPRNTLLTDIIVINTTTEPSGRGGIYTIGAVNARCTNCTIMGLDHGTAVQLDDGADATTYETYPSFTGTNILMANNTANGFWSTIGATAGTNFTLDYVNAFNNTGANFSPPATDARITHELSTDPQLGTCRAWIPGVSPMKGAGLGGVDIGGNVLYQYVNGTLTTTPIWNTTTGAFTGCGALVSGLNDTAGNSCSNVHTRLNINSGGCSFPSGYGSAATPAPIYVSAGGHGGETPSDSNSCSMAESITTPKATITSALSCMTVPGKVLYVRGGTYNTVIDTAATPITGGSVGAYTKIEGYQSEVATIQLPIGQAVGVWLRVASDSYIELRNLTIDGMNRSGSNGVALYSTAQHIKLTNMTIKNTTFEPLFISGADFVDVVGGTFINSTMAGVGVNGTVTDLLLKGNTIHDHTGSGIDLNTGGGSYTNATLLGNMVYSVGSDGTSPAIQVGAGSNGLVANNLMHNSRAGLLITTGASGLKVMNNTITMNTTYGVQCNSGATGVQFTNNIVYANGTQLVNNCGATLATNLTTNPSFALVSGVNSDFHLTAASTTAIGQGTNLSSYFTTDYDNVARPASGAGNWDIGAYQFTAGPPSEAYQLEFGVQPSTTIVSNVINPSPTVQVQRDDGVLVSSSTAQVTVALVATQIPFANLTLVSVDSSEPGHLGGAAIDGNVNTYWQSQVTGGVTSHPHNVIVSFPSTSVNGVRYTTRLDAAVGGIVGYDIYVSTDCSTWGTAVASGTFNTIGLGKAYGITFPAKTGSCLRLLTASGVGGTSTSSIAELDVMQLSSTVLNGTKAVNAFGGASTFNTLSVSNVLNKVVLQATSLDLVPQLSQPFDVITAPGPAVQPPLVLRFIPPK